MAVSLTAATTRSFNLDRPISFPRSNKLSSLTSLQLPLLRRLPTENRRRFLAPPQRQIIFRVEAKKQTFSTFDELLENSGKPVLVDFYATWCGPCQYMAPILNEVGDTLKDKIQVVKVDTEKYPSIADRYRIEALPTFIIFKDGKPCDRFEGALPADQLTQRIENALKVTQ